jgi:TPR repeat protein
LNDLAVVGYEQAPSHWARLSPQRTFDAKLNITRKREPKLDILNPSLYPDEREHTTSRAFSLINPVNARDCSNRGAVGHLVTLVCLAQTLCMCVPTWAMVSTAQTPAEYTKQIAQTTRKAFAGDPEAEFEIGDWYCYGSHGKRVSLKRAAEWYLEAAKQGNIPAQWAIAELYEFGEGVRPDHAKALDWIRKATAEYPQSAMSIAYDYKMGLRKSLRRGCILPEKAPKDPVKAVEWYRIAAESGYAIAQTDLAELYEREPAVRNLEEALHWYRKAAETYGPAMAGLAHLYATGTGVPQDYDEAAKWYRKAVERDGHSGQYELGLLYEQGLGVAKDREKTLGLYYGAAPNNGDAQRRLFALYEADLALPSNLDMVIAWYEAAAEEGNPVAQAGLGLHYQFGKGVATNGYVANALYLIARLSSGRQSENSTFMGPKDIVRWAAAMCRR